MSYRITEHEKYLRAVIEDDASLEDFVQLFREMKTLCATRGVDRAMVVVSHGAAGSVPSFEHLSSYAGAGFMDGFKLALVCAGWALYRACQKAERAAEKAGVRVRAFFQETEGSRWLAEK